MDSNPPALSLAGQAQSPRAPGRPLPVSFWVGGCIAAACVAIATLTIVLPEGSIAAEFLLDHGPHSLFAPIYPLTIQNLLHVLTAAAIGVLLHRWRRVRIEAGQLSLKLLPEDDQTILPVDQLGPLRRRVLAMKSGAMLPELIDAVILQVMTTRSIERSAGMLTAKLDLLSHRIELDYQVVRYLAWVVPTIGFIGTVVGIAIALAGINDPQHLDLTRITSGLAIAFYTTILALLESAVIVFLQNIVQTRDEMTLNRAAEYCLSNLINRLYVTEERSA
ncbi:MAG TPA: MotA/TolQ/ExbB proton channel family protein [Roseiarcus sp.]|nr:MotA/TolQ/ExbB proton channel family protein [Roseiarcus sp.]